MESTLNIDLFFFAALQQSEAVREMVKDRIFDTYRSTTAENEDKLPYLIITTGEAQADPDTKDDFVATVARGMVSVLVCAKDTKQFARLQSLVLQAVETANETDDIYDDHEEWDFPHLHIEPRPLDKMADPEKPCLFREIQFLCEI